MNKGSPILFLLFSVLAVIFTMGFSHDIAHPEQWYDKLHDPRHLVWALPALYSICVSLFLGLFQETKRIAIARQVIFVLGAASYEAGILGNVVCQIINPETCTDFNNSPWLTGILAALVAAFATWLYIGMRREFQSKYPNK